MFFINGRVFIINKLDNVIEIDQTDLRKLFNTHTILNFERLGRKYSYGSLFTIAENYAKENGLKISVKKYGMSCQ